MSVRTFSMRRAKPPAGHIELVEALQTCAIKWECARDAAWPKLRSALINGRVGSVRRETNENAKRIDPITWNAIENDTACVTGLHEHPGAIRYRVEKFAAAFVNKVHLEIFLAETSPNEEDPAAGNDSVESLHADAAASNAIQDSDSSDVHGAGRKKPGRKDTYDWHGMYCHLLACHERAALTRASADAAGEAFFRGKGTKGQYPDHLKRKIWQIFKEAKARKRSLSEVLADKAKTPPA